MAYKPQIYHLLILKVWPQFYWTKIKVSRGLSPLLEPFGEKISCLPQFLEDVFQACVPAHSPSKSAAQTHAVGAATLLFSSTHAFIHAVMNINNQVHVWALGASSRLHTDSPVLCDLFTIEGKPAPGSGVRTWTCMGEHCSVHHIPWDTALSKENYELSLFLMYHHLDRQAKPSVGLVQSIT